MREDFLIGGAEEGLVAEVARSEKAVMQAASVTDVEPLALGAAALRDIFRTLVSLRPLYARQDVGK